mgnify:CR=1 FL=1
MNRTKQNLVSLYTISRKEIIRILRIWQQSLLPSVITISLYYIVFGSLIGPRIGEMSGYDYIAFIVPGLIMLAVVTNSYSNVVASFFGNKFQKAIEEILVSPVPNHVIILGFVLGGVFRGLFVGLLVTLVSLFFTKLYIHNILILILVVVLTSILFSLAGLLNGIFAKKFDDVSFVPTFVLTPLIYLGGVFYSISMLPQLWQYISLANPLLYMVNAFRYGFLGTSDISIIFAFVMIIFFIVLFYVISWYLLKKGYGMRS